jgi:hypothetical protein
MSSVDWQWVSAFVIAALLSWPFNRLVRMLFRNQMRHCAQSIVDRDRTRQVSVDAKFREIETHFDMESAPLIGKVERILYIFGIMFTGAYAIISGWLVLKAFNTWLEGLELAGVPANPAAAATAPATTQGQQDPADYQRERDRLQEERNRLKADRMSYYHLYLYGNALSLLTGLALGVIGLQIRMALPDLLHRVKDALP